MTQFLGIWSAHELSVNGKFPIRVCTANYDSLKIESLSRQSLGNTADRILWIIWNKHVFLSDYKQWNNKEDSPVRKLFILSNVGKVCEKIISSVV